ncbi:toll-like receptor 13 [Clupea harengus]|uniref:Toll-like receptor 13 n=1 Tax=Clupea harengus TaxID=7950 RepID=A0A6P8GGV9_CLUHA|nr:toll-like receptor 13 [Clupea harengus]
MTSLHIFLLVSVQVFCIWAWLSQKCLLFYEDGSYSDNNMLFFGGTCPRSNATAVCRDVTDIELELSAIMADIEILCLWVNHGSSLQPAIFSKFHNLRSMYIYGCLSAILPEAFRGLSNLHLLSMASPERCNTSAPSKVFNDLHILEELKLQNYTLSEMAADVFDGLSHMKRLDVKGNDDFSELLCKLSYFSASLEYLGIKMEDAVVLTTPNCTYGPIRFPSLREVNFSFPRLKSIEQIAFRYFDRVSLLNMPMNDVLQTQLLHSGIQQLDQMQFSLNEVNIKSICEIVFALSVSHISLHFDTLQEYSESSWEKCYKLEEITLDGQNLTNIDLSFMSTLKNVTFFEIETDGACTTVEDESLTTLCTRHVSLTALRSFIYRTNQYLTLSTNLFVCVSHLEQLVLEGKFTRIESFAFEGLNNLRFLELKMENYFAPEEQHTTEKNCLKNVTILDTISQGNLTVEKDAFKGLTVLRVLYFKAHILAIKAKYFLGLENLLELQLSVCRIQTIEDFAFANLGQLKKMSLSFNRISKIQMNTFKGLQNLERLMLDNNPLKDLEASSFSHFPSLRVLHLGNLMFSNSEHSGMQVLNLSLIFGGFPHQLSDLTITSAVRPMTLVIADDSAPDEGLSLSLSGQKIVLWGCERRFFKSVIKLHVTADHFLCAPDLTVALQHFTSVVDLFFSQWYTSTIQDLSGLSRLVHLKRLKLTNIDFYKQPGFNVMFNGLTKLESLSLYNCLVNSFDRVISVDMKSLKYLYLHISSETTVYKQFFEPLNSLRSVVLFDPRLFCNCENSWFISWAKQESQVGVFPVSKQHRTLQCLNGNRLQDLDRYGLSHCRPEEGFELFLSTTGLLVFFIVAVLVYRLHSNTRGHYRYDVFVSHSGENESWVVERLLPSLEQRGPPFLRLCLSRKEFQLGKDTVENITDSLYRSRRTLCLVSRHFLRSNWCSLEMRLGTYRLQVEHRDVLILVFLEKIPSNLLSAHHRLARLVKTRTYIDWPQDPAQQEAFWDILWNKLVTEKVL